MTKEQATRDEASAGASFSSVMAAVVFFFIGLLITGDEELQFQLRIPLYCLFVSAYAFIFSTTLYANATASRLSDLDYLNRTIDTADLISELLGLFFLIYAMPLVILGYSPDKTLGILLYVTGSLFLFIYHYLGFSILEIALGENEIYRIITGLITIHGLVFVFSYMDQQLLSELSSVVLGGLTILLFWRCYRETKHS